MLLVILITVGFVLVAYLGYSALEIAVMRRSRIQRRVNKLSEELDPLVSETPTQEEMKEPDSFPTISKIISSYGVANNLLALLSKGGVKLRPSEFLGLTSGLALLLGMIMMAITNSVIAVIVGISLGSILPFVYLNSLGARRLRAFDAQIPDALAMMASAIRSGFSFQRSMHLVADEMPNPISEEFKRVIDEMNVGVAMDTALARMTARVPCYEIQLVETAIIIQQQVGGNLGEVFDKIAKTILERVRVQGEIDALTAEGKMSGVLMMAMPFGLAAVISVISPGYLMPLIKEPLGQSIIVGAIILQIVGAIIIKRMLIMDY